VKRLLVVAAFFVLAVPASATTARILAPLDWWPVWSPNGARIAFTRVYPNHMELYTVAVAGGRVTRIASNSFQLAPTWSSTGTRLAYAVGGVLWIANADGTGKHRYVAPTRAFAPAWRPGTAELAYLTTHGSKNTDLWVAGRLWAPNAIGVPAWSPDGKQLAFQRDDGIYVATGPGAERRVVSIANPGPPAWSHDGLRIAYAVKSVAFVVAADGSRAPISVANALSGIRTPSWSPDDSRLVLPYDRGVTTVRSAGGDGQGTGVKGASGPGAVYAPTSTAIAASGARPGCPAHAGIVEFAGETVKPLSGSCLIVGTPKADVIEGTPLWGDVIEAGAGNDQVHANDGHTDRVNCGPGRDTVWADRTDRLTGCEIVHR
jgi:dipeptidyl aminopeptidase/acylaminoacyl peptidase